MEDINLSMFNMITGINESKTFAKYISRKCKCKFDERKRNSDQWWNNDKCRCECKKHYMCENDYAWSPATCNCKNGKYLANMDNSTIIFDKVIDSYDEEIKTIQQILIKQVNSKTQSFYILLVFLLIIIVLFIAASIYCCLIKYHAKNLF